jgi:mono/diheme cytochrome c family protein
VTSRALLGLAAAIAAVGLFTGGLAWLLETPRVPAGVSVGQRLYTVYCATCHGEDGRGSWRAALFLIRPGDLADRERMRQHSDQYLFDIVKHGGSPIGRPGMPGFEHLSDDDVRELVRYLRRLSGTAGAAGAATPAGR